MSFKQFESDFLDAFQPTVAGLFAGKEGNELVESFGGFLIEGKDPKPIKRSHTVVDRYKTVLFSGFDEISGSFYTLRDIETIIAGLTTRQSKLANTRLLSYHIHNYLNENYILECRLNQYPVKILRTSKRRSEVSNQIIEPIRQAVSNTFVKIRTTRGKHVHDRRYTDTELIRLSMLERATKLANPNLQKPLLALFRIEFSTCRGKWLDRIRNNNNVIEELLDVYFEALRPYILNKTGNILIPSEIKGI